MKTALTLIFVALALALAPVRLASASFVTIDFNSLAHGDIVTGQFPGVTIALLGSPPIAGPRAYALKDGAMANTGNPVSFFGADGLAITPSSDVTESIFPPFFDLEFGFTDPIDFFSILVLDAEDSEIATAHGFLGADLIATHVQGTLLGVHSFVVFNGPVRELTLGAIGGPLLFDRVVLDINNDEGPEIYDNLRFNTVATRASEPATASLVVMGFVWLALASRRSRKWGTPVENGPRSLIGLPRSRRPRGSGFLRTGPRPGTRGAPAT